MYVPHLAVLSQYSFLALTAEINYKWKMAEYFWKLDGKSKWWILKWKWRTRKLRRKGNI